MLGTFLTKTPQDASPPTDITGLISMREEQAIGTSTTHSTPTTFQTLQRKKKPTTTQRIRCRRPPPHCNTRRTTSTTIPYPPSPRTHRASSHPRRNHPCGYTANRVNITSSHQPSTPTYDHRSTTTTTSNGTTCTNHHATGPTSPTTSTSTSATTSTATSSAASASSSSTCWKWSLQRKCTTNIQRRKE